MEQLDFLSELQAIDYSILDSVDTIPKSWERHSRERRVAYLEFKRDTDYVTGYVREDGMVFWAYSISSDEFSVWLTKEKFEEYQEKERKRTNKRGEKRKNVVDVLDLDERLKKGDVREDGMIFWCYHGSYENGERWVTPEAYEQAAKYNRVAGRKFYKKKSSDDLFKFSRCMVNYIRSSYSYVGAKKDKSKDEIIGLSMPELKDHLISQFKEGMKWDDRGKTWHTDHRLPLSAAETQEEIEMLWHYTNLQPMWALENILKGAKHCPKELEEFFKVRRAEKECN